MKHKINHHPSYSNPQDIADICKPLSALDITYFCHANMDKQGQFSAIGTNPLFGEQYIQNEYYNHDIHTAEDNPFGNFVIWDNISLSGKSYEMDKVAKEFGIDHAFTIIEDSDNGSHYYHFASATKSTAFNQVYINNIDLLKLFIKQFNLQINQSKILSKANDIKFATDINKAGFSTNEHGLLLSTEGRSNFIRFIKDKLPNKISADMLTLSPKRLECFMLLIKGHSAKEIAQQLNISYRTVEHHITTIRQLLGYRNSKELIADYSVLLGR